MTTRTVRHNVPDSGIYVYARSHKEKTELIVLNGTNKVQVVPFQHYREILNGSRSGQELISGKKIDLTKSMTLSARQSLIIEL